MSEPGARTEAGVRRTRWPGWIWAVPLAAVLVVGWLALKALAQGGEDITVTFDDAARAKPGDTQVFYRGVEMGQLKKVELAQDGRQVVMTLKMDDRAKPYLRQRTRFWLIGAEPSLSNPRSLASIVAGPSIGMEPGGGAPATRFVGAASAPAVKGGPLGPQYPYETNLPGDVGALAVGAPVKLRGFAVGQVRAVRLAYDPRTGRLSAPVALELDPARLGLPATAGRAALDRALAGWIAQGLRAKLGQDPPLVGARTVNLEFSPGATPARLQGGAAYPLIPSAPSAGLNDLGQLAGRADSILTKVDAVPIAQIGANVRDATARVRTLVASPKLSASLDHLDATLAEVDRTVHQVSPQVKPMVLQLRRAADAIQQTAAAANQVVGGSPESQNSDLPAALHELTEAARSLRSLADYLDRHPEALIKGRKGDSR